MALSIKSTCLRQICNNDRTYCVTASRHNLLQVHPLGHDITRHNRYSDRNSAPSTWSNGNWVPYPTFNITVSIVPAKRRNLIIYTVRLRSSSVPCSSTLPRDKAKLYKILIKPSSDHIRQVPQRNSMCTPTVFNGVLRYALLPDAHGDHPSETSTRIRNMLQKLPLQSPTPGIRL